MPAQITNSTLLDNLMNRLRIPVTNTTERAKIQTVVNDVYADICAKQDWWWLQRRIAINTKPKITTGTINLTEGQDTAFLSTPPQQIDNSSGVLADVTVEGYSLVVPGSTPDGNAVYTVLTHTSGGVTVVLDEPYTGTTDTTAAYRLYKVTYNLPDTCAKVLQVKRYGFREPIQRIGIEDLSYLRMNNLAEGKPQVYSVFDFSTNNDVSTRRMLQIHPYPDHAYRMEVWYKYMQGMDTSTNLELPADYTQVLDYGSLARCYPIFLNDTERGAYYQGLFNDVMALMSAQQREYASDHPGITTDMRAYRRGSIRPRVPYTLGNYFDILPSQP